MIVGEQERFYQSVPIQLDDLAAGGVNMTDEPLRHSVTLTTTSLWTQNFIITDSHHKSAMVRKL